MNGLDIYVQSSSYGEGFPNVVAEAMTYKVPCIATNVGDANYIIGKTGWIVPPKNSFKLALVIENAFLEINKKNWKKRCIQSRDRIEKNFGINKMIDIYLKIWTKVHSQNRHNLIL
jgi:glycosyltransferase involved in cell wall biosynthesis